METFDSFLRIAIQVCTVGGIVFMIYRSYSDPDIKTDKEMGINQATCNLKHKIIDDKFQEISDELTLIKENHLAHIERSIANIDQNIAVILDRQNIRLSREEKNKL